jgi:hypothetical protein
MSFASTDYLRVLNHLSLAIAAADLVKTQLTASEADSGLEQAIKDTLDELDTLRSTLSTERSSANAALIRADVLEWQSGQRTEGMEQERLELQLQLANLLGVEWSVSRRNYSGVTEVQIWHG